MSVSRLPRVGSEYGPCIEECNHTDCKKTIEMANSFCPICGSIIGYENPFYEENGRLFHELCLVEKVQNEKRVK